MLLFLKLLLAHLLGDFVFQRESWIQDKQRRKIRSSKLYIHIGIHALCLLLLLEFEMQYWPVVLIILGTHYLIDLGKLYIQSYRSGRKWFFLDQLLHLLVLVIVSKIYLTESAIGIQLMSKEILLLLTALLLITQAGAIIIMVVLKPFTPEGYSKSGSLIGQLERVIIFILAIGFHWMAVSILLVAKAIFRFNELKKGDKQLTTYIIAGNLMSFALASVTAVLYLYLLGKM